MEKYLYNLILKLRDKHEIILLLPNRYNIAIEKVKIYNFYEIPLPLFSLVTVFVSLFITVPRILLKERPQLISAFIPSWSSSILFFIAKVFGIKKVLNLRGIWQKSQIASRVLSGPSFLLSDALITNSKELFFEYEQILPIPRNLYRSVPKFYIPNGVSTDFWKSSNNIENQGDLVFVGNLHSNKRIFQKGFKLLYSSVKYIEKKYDYSVKNIIIGKYNKKLIQNIIGPSKSNLFEWKGLILDRTLLKKLIQSAKIFVLTSEVEGMPNALMEAMSLGMPCISTQVGAVSELITDNYNGFIVPKRNHKELGEKIWLLLKNEALQGKFGKNARKTMESRFTWERNVHLVEKCYLSIITH